MYEGEEKPILRLLCTDTLPAFTKCLYLMPAEARIGHWVLWKWSYMTYHVGIRN